jgi:hypothetical protein
MFRTFAPCHATMARMRDESRVTGLGPVADCNSGVRAMAFSSGACNPNLRMSKFIKPSVELEGRNGPGLETRRIQRDPVFRGKQIEIRYCPSEWVVAA